MQEPAYWIIWACTAAIFFFLLRLYSGRSKLPPGPVSWPLVGSLFSLGRSRHRSFAQLANKYGPIMYVEIGSRPSLVISSASMAKELLKVHDAEFASRPQYATLSRHVSHNFNDLLFSPDGDRWKTLRRICAMELFTASKVSHFSGIRKRELAAFASSITKSASNEEVINMSILLHELFTNLMSCVLFGRKFYSSDTPVTPEAEHYRAVWGTLIAESERVFIGDAIPALRWIDKLRRADHKIKHEVVPAVVSFLDAIIEEHRKECQADNPRDFVDVLLSLSGDDKLGNDAIVPILQNMLLAGTGTSKANLEWGLSELICNPRVLHKAQEEIDRVVGKDRFVEESDLKNLPYIQALVKEIMRLHPAAPMGLPHYNNEAAHLAGYTIPPQTTVLVNIWAISRDPTTWKDPEQFYPERFLATDHTLLGADFDFIPFSSGRRRCVGIPLALPHITLTLAYLLHRFDWGPPPGIAGHEIDMSETTGLVCVPSKPLMVSASPRLAFEATSGQV